MPELRGSHGEGRTHLLTRWFGTADLHRLEVYEGDPKGYAGARQAIVEMSQDEVITQVKESGLRGRGGAGFPTGTKWGFIPKGNEEPKYVVVNADESEPGTSKDRYLMENAPHMLLEGIMIAAYAIGSNQAWIYLRGEYDRPHRMLTEAIAEARAKGHLGERPFGRPHPLDIRIYRGHGAYICGEETALLESLEGKRAQPRSRPPFPAIKGAWGRPTLVNNVETLAYLVPILERGPEWFSAVGTERSKGYKIVSISGHVQKPGNYEIPLGTPLRELLEIACGSRPGRKLMAIQPCGGSSAFIFEEHLDLPYDYESLQKAGTMLGSGAMAVMADTTDFVPAAFNLVRFYANNSSGQYTPCNEGAHWLVSVLHRFLLNRTLQSDIVILVRVRNEITGV